MPQAMRNVQVVQVNDYKKQPRRVRSPKHPFNIKARPYEITSFFIAPVLPGETLSSGFLQASVVSDKIADPLIGWWHEYHLFYIPIRAFTQGDNQMMTPEDMESLFIDPTFTAVTSYSVGANSVPFYMFKCGVQWMDMCYEFITRKWFRDEGEALTPTWDNYNIAKIDQGNLFNSLKEESALADDDELPGVDEQEELDILPGFTTHYAQWELMRDQGMTDLTYSDFLRSYGITPPKELDVAEGTGEPMLDAEKIISIRKWTNPTLAPQQGDAESTSVVYWRPNEKITKRILCTEPGFLFGVTVTRPKVYLGNQKGSGVGMLDNAYSWLPAVLNELGYTSLRENLDSATDGILQGGDEDYWLDVKDLFLYGDQFVNHALSAHFPALPVASNLDKKYLTETMMNELFAVTDGSASYIKQDGVLHLDILGRIRETSPQT